MLRKFRRKYDTFRKIKQNIISDQESYQLSVPFGVGFLELHSSKDAITHLKFCDNNAKESAFLPEILLEAKKQLLEYLDGKRLTFELKLSPEGTEFQQKVWNELQKIPFGKTISYQELANKLGDPKVIRAAASANGKNPIGLIIPCHRVIGTSGKLVGFAGGLPRKQWLLEHENKYANGVLTLF